MSEFIRLQANGVDAYPDASTENTYRSNGTSVESALLALESNVNTLGGVAGEAKTLAEQNSVKIATAEQEISDINSSLETLTIPNTVKVYDNGSDDYIELLICGKIVICQGVLSNKTGTITTFPEKYLPIVNIRFYVNGIDATLYTDGGFYSSKTLSGFFNFTYLLA